MSHMVFFICHSEPIFIVIPRTKDEESLPAIKIPRYARDDMGENRDDIGKIVIPEWFCRESSPVQYAYWTGCDILLYS